MSLTTAPNFNDYIDRFALILEKSSLVMPKTNGDNTKKDLFSQIIKYTFPIPEQPPEGLGPPHLYINKANNPVIRREKAGRDSLNEHGFDRWTMEFYLIPVIQEYDPLESQKSMYTAVSAILTALGKNRRLTDDSGNNPLAATLVTDVRDWDLHTNDNTLYAQNIIVRITVYVNLRP
jgi:hypothetical protein